MSKESSATKQPASTKGNGARGSDSAPPPSPRTFAGFSEITSFIWSVADLQLLFDQFIAAAKQDREVVERALANPLDNFELAMKPKVEGLMIDRMDQNQEIVNRYLNDPAFQAVAFRALVKRIYEDIRGAGNRPPAR